MSENATELLLESKRALKVKIKFLFWIFKAIENVELLTAVCAKRFFGRGGVWGKVRVGSLSPKAWTYWPRASPRCSTIICRLFKLSLSDQAPVTRQLSVSFSDFVSRYLARPTLREGPKFFFFSARPELAPGGPEEGSGTDCNRLRIVSDGWLCY